MHQFVQPLKKREKNERKLKENGDINGKNKNKKPAKNSEKVMKEIAENRQMRAKNDEMKNWQKIYEK